MPTTDIIIRRARRDDLGALGRFGAVLLRTHHEFDRARFMAPGNDREGGYAGSSDELGTLDARILVAERGGAIVGYVYVAIEPQSWKELRDEAGFIHDVIVDERAAGQAPRLHCSTPRSIGCGRAAFRAWCSGWRMQTPARSDSSRASASVRRLIEMTRELDDIRG